MRPSSFLTTFNRSTKARKRKGNRPAMCMQLVDLTLFKRTIKQHDGKVLSERDVRVRAQEGEAQPSLLATVHTCRPSPGGKKKSEWKHSSMLDSGVATILTPSQFSKQISFPDESSSSHPHAAGPPFSCARDPCRNSIAGVLSSPIHTDTPVFFKKFCPFILKK